MEFNKPDNNKSNVKKKRMRVCDFIKQNLTAINLSRTGLSNIDKHPIQFSSYLREINLSLCNLTSVPNCVINLKNLKKLDVSWNNIQFFNNTPLFLDNIEELNISNNKLLNPPRWLWTESPLKLMRVDLSNNPNITNSFEMYPIDFEELLQYETQVKEVFLENTNLFQYKKLISTFVNATHIYLGSSDMCNTSCSDTFPTVPCEGLEDCIKVESLNLRYSETLCLMPTINIYTYLRQIDLSHNNLCALPEEFCELKNLERCLLSCNHIQYLPKEITTLNKLKILCLDNNLLTMLPDNFSNMKRLKKLDLYDNCLNVLPDIEGLEEVDLAKNYFEEPCDETYINKREKIRLNGKKRSCGKKFMISDSDLQPEPDTIKTELDVESS